MLNKLHIVADKNIPFFKGTLDNIAEVEYLSGEDFSPEKIKNADRLDFLERLYLEIHPSVNWQERALNFSSFFVENGSVWLKNCYQKMDVDKSMLILMEY